MPRLADDLRAGYRYHAARAAALAGWRKQALAWLQEDLAAWGACLEGGSPKERAAARRELEQWQSDPDLAGVRDNAALGKLPADEQKAFTQLWADVAALLKKAETTAAKEGK